MYIENTLSLSLSSSFICKDNIYYQKNLLRPNLFEINYLKLRSKEGRVYPDNIVKGLPFFDWNQYHKKEWLARSLSYRKLVNGLGRKKKRASILEIGCGNGWLSNKLSIAFSEATVYAMDINETELLQGQRVFNGRLNLKFIYADIFTCSLSNKSFDVIILAACLGYIQGLSALLSRMLELLSPSGEIHLVDNPFYQPHEIDNVRKRSVEYLNRIECPEMELHYYHHDWRALQPFHFEVLYDPLSVRSRFKRLVRGDSPFPWIKIRSLNTWNLWW
jgi:ubiquinone/menaquinone biosynthesis C-methylase UbiE